MEIFRQGPFTGASSAIQAGMDGLVEIHDTDLFELLDWGCARGSATVQPLADKRGMWRLVALISHIHSLRSIRFASA